MACVLTGHLLKDRPSTVAYHSYSQADLEKAYGEYGIRSSEFGNRPVAVANDLGAIIDAIRKADR